MAGIREGLYMELKAISDSNVDVKEGVREKHSQEKEYENEVRMKAQTQAVHELFEELSKTAKDNMMNKAADGYYECLVAAVSLDPSMDCFATHEPGKPYVTTNYENKEYVFTLRSLFWNKEWKSLWYPFQLHYRWNKSQTLLSVYVNWSR